MRSGRTVGLLTCWCLLIGASSLVVVLGVDVLSSRPLNRQYRPHRG